MKNNVLPPPKSSAAASPLKQFITGCSISCLIALIIGAALISLCAVILTKADMPHSLLEPITTILTAIATLISVYLGSLSANKASPSLGMGVSSGAMVFAVIFLVSLIFGDGEISGQTMIKLLALVSAGGIGSLAGGNHQRKKKLKI